MARYADDSTLYVTGDNLESVLKQLVQAAKLLFQWFSDNQIKENEDKSHVLTSTQEVCGNIGTTQITNKKWEIYEKVGAKLNALTRIANHMPFQKRKVFTNAFFPSQFSYCPLTWMFHSRKLNINNTISLSCHDHVCLIRLRFERYFSHPLPS